MRQVDTNFSDINFVTKTCKQIRKNGITESVTRHKMGRLLQNASLLQMPRNTWIFITFLFEVGFAFVKIRKL